MPDSRPAVANHRLLVMRARISRVLLAAALVSGEALAQPKPKPAPPPPTFEVRGRVISATSGDLLSRVRIAATSSDDLLDAVFTDDGGRFAVVVSRTAGVTLAISKAGFAASQVRLRPDDVKAGTIADVKLERGAAITGRVTDASGVPVVATVVTARRERGLNADAAPFARTETDDRGEYRVGGLAEGRYVLFAGSSDPFAKSVAADTMTRNDQRRGAVRREPTPFPPISIDVKPGDDLTGVNLVVEPVPARSKNSEAPEPVLFGERLVGRAALQGRMLAESGEALDGGSVVLFRQQTPVRRATADADGRFVFRDIQAGRYTLHGSKPGYVNLQYGQHRSTDGGRTITLRDDDTLRGLQLVLPRGSAVVGTVVDEHGDPVEGATMRALQIRSVNGRKMAFGVPGVRERRSDDRGQYRLFGLLPGSYLISASVDAAVSPTAGTDKSGYAPTFYPGATDVRDAWQLQIDVRRDAFGAHIVLARSPAVRVSGVVLDSKGNGLRGTVLLATSQRSGAIGLEPRLIPVAGAFVFTNVTPGHYVIQANREEEGDRPPEFAAQFLSVSEVEPARLFLMTLPTTTLVGRILIDERISRDFGAVMSFAPVPADLDFAPRNQLGRAVTLHGDGAFRMTGMAGPMRFALFGVPPGWYLKSIVVNGREAADLPYDFGLGFMQSADARIFISTAGASIHGQVTDARSKPVSEYTAVAFPTDRRKWIPHSRYLKVARPSQDDSFEMTGLPPGEYWVAAAETLDLNLGTEWQDHEVLDKLAKQARRVTVGEGDVAEVTLTVIRW